MSDKPANTAAAKWIALTLALGCGLAAPVVEAEPWQTMWLLASAFFFAAKAAILSRARQLRAPVAFTLLWPGMNAGEWQREAQSSAARLRWSLAGLLNLSLGAALLFGLARHLESPLAAAWLGVVGFILMMHCGVFTCLAAWWQQWGFGVRPIMHWPLLADSLTDFWGRRWNLAYRDLSQTLLLRPLASRWGVKTAAWLVFLISGLIHEVVISVPAQGGYGGPTLYFMIQGIGHALEQRCRLTSPLVWRLRAWFLLLVPLPLLAHAPFMLGVMRPFFIAVGALPE